MTFKQLEAFYAAALASSFAAAATQLHLSQSSLSKRLGELESDLGEVLFDRTGHRSVLTSAGQALLPLARDMLQAARHARDTIGKNTGLQGVCRFGMGELAAVTWLPRFVARCRRDFPDLRLEPHVDVGQSLERQVEAGELDFAVVAGWSSRSAIASHTIAEVRYDWVGTDAQLGDIDVLTPESLKDMTVITMPQGAGSTRIFEAWMVDNKLAVSRQLICNNMGAIAGMVAAGVGIAFFPNAWLTPLREKHGLRAIAGEPPLRPLHYAFQSRREDIRPLVAAMRERVMLEVDFEAPHVLW
ncbi:LysR family transcriptional regulator [Alcaligenaceae bacterium A4P071]|nr:LysR family transcriptional regulator [Alcaligenaceae bacterium A4P071]